MAKMSEEFNRMFQGYQVSGISQEGEETVMSVENESGSGTMRCYHVFPGIFLVYNNMSMKSCYQRVEPVSGFLQMNHCRRGCFEFELENGSRCFMGEGDLAVNDPEILTVVNSRFPLGKYEGITVMMELEPASKWLEENVPWANVDLYEMKKKLGIQDAAFMVRASAGIRHIFDELYEVDERIRRSYIILKIVEMIMFLGLTAEEKQEYLPRFSSTVADGTKAVHEYLSKYPLERLTLTELSARFHIAETSLKCCFKAIYGQTPGAFMRRERLKIGARLLIGSPEMSIGEIALQVGYENPSKFARAFKVMFGETPLSYRHKGVSMTDWS